MTISSIGQSLQNQPAPPSQGAVLSSDFTTFLKMLTVQMQNQNPLNPIDSADYAVQLATFSGVEQQVQTNQLLGNIGQQLSLNGLSQLAGWIGQEARAAADVWFDGSAITLAPSPEAHAERAVLVVQDESGAIRSREELPLSAAPYRWLGADGEGEPLPEGRYRLTLESWRGDEVSRVDQIESYREITEARSSGEGSILVLQGGIEVPASKVTALRRSD